MQRLSRATLRAARAARSSSASSLPRLSRGIWIPPTRTQILFGRSASIRGLGAGLHQLRSFSHEAGLDEDEESDQSGLVPFGFHQERSKTYERFWENLLSGASAVAALKDWEAAGNKFTRDTLAVTLQRLKCRRLYGQAMELLSWVLETKPFDLIEGDFAQLITLSCRQKDFSKAEAALRAVPVHLSKSPAFCALVTGYASWDMVRKVELLVRTAKSPLPQAYSSMMLMYIRTGLYNKIPELYERMKSSGLEPNVITYVLLLKYKDRIGEIQGLNKEAEAALDKVNLETICSVKRTSVAGNMMNAYAMLGKLDKVEKIWKRMDQERFLPEGFYISTVEALALLGEVKKAEKVAEMKPTEKVQGRLFQALARHYAKQGNMKRAEEMLAKYENAEMVPCFGIYNHLVTGYLARNDGNLAASRMRLALKVVTDERAVPSYAAVMGVLPVLAQQKDVVTAEQLVKRYKGWRDEKFHSELLKVYESAGKSPSEEVNKALQRRISTLDVDTRRRIIRAQSLRTKMAASANA